MKIWSEGWRSWFTANNYWRGGWRANFCSFLNRLGNALAAFNDIQSVFEKLHGYEAALKDIADWEKNYNLGGDPLPGWHPAKVAETVLGKQWVEHIVEEGSREHVLWWDEKGRHCKVANCEVNRFHAQVGDDN